jgi:outer membrane protein assembly factor BamB
MRYLIIGFVGSLTLLLGIGAAAPPAEAEPPPAGPLAKARQLLAEGKHEACLAELEAAAKALPADHRLFRWRLDTDPKKEGPWLAALPGKKKLYFTSYGGRGRLPPSALEDKQPLVSDVQVKYDFHVVITCMDLATGKRLWTRQTAGDMMLAVDPQSDDLYVWRTKLFRLSADKGEIVLTKDIPPDRRRPAGIIVDGRIITPRLRQWFLHWEQTPVAAFDVSTGTVKEFKEADLLLPQRLSPDERKVLRVHIHQSPGKVSKLIECSPLGVDKPLWAFEHPSYCTNDPFWHGKDVFALVGPPDGKAEVVRLDGETGKPRWRFAMPRGAYWPGSSQAMESSYPTRDWSAIGFVGKHLVAIGGEGTLYFLDPDSGKLAGTYAGATHHRMFPQLVAGNVVVVAPRSMRSIPLGMILARPADSEVDALLLEARVLAAQNKPRLALERIDRVLDFDAHAADAWLQRAEVLKTLEHVTEEIAARCRWMNLLKKETDAEMRQRFGLIKLIPTGHDISAYLAQAGDVIYAGTLAGSLYAIDTRSLEIIERREHPTGFTQLRIESRLLANGEDRADGELPQVNQGPPTNVPKEWYENYTGYDGPTVRRGNAFYRPVADGAVRILRDGKVTVHKSQVPGIKHWRITFTADGPLGHGTRGVYELDDNLCPKRLLIDLGKERSSPSAYEVYHLAADGQTIALVTGAWQTPVVQIWTRDGEKMLREVAVQVPIEGTHAETNRLTPVNGGYLYSGSELIWCAGGKDGPLWRFGVGTQPGRALPPVRYLRTSLYGFPIIAHDRLFISCRDGGIYIFDLKTVTKRP